MKKRNSGMGEGVGRRQRNWSSICVCVRVCVCVSVCETVHWRKNLGGRAVHHRLANGMLET